MSYYNNNGEYPPPAPRRRGHYPEAEPLMPYATEGARRRPAYYAPYIEYEAAGQGRRAHYHTQRRPVVSSYHRSLSPRAKRLDKRFPTEADQALPDGDVEDLGQSPALERRYTFGARKEEALKDEDAWVSDRSGSPVFRRERNRSRSRSRYGHQVIYPIAYESLDLDNYDDFTFDCDKPDPFESGDSLSFDISSLDPGMSPADADRGAEDSRVKPIYHSRYTGDAETGGSHTAELTEIQNGSGGELFKWLHIEQKVMSFEEFWAEISRRVHISDIERRAINRLRADVTRLCVKSRYNPKGVNVGYMEPQFLQTPLDTPKKKFAVGHDDAPETMVRWICMPFFVLEQYSGLSVGSGTGTFPSQTLLQAQYSRTTEQRDMAQAVCELGIAQKGECFHIDQLWCLVVGDSLLVTCSSKPRSSLEGDVIKLTSAPSRALSAASSPARILVKYGNFLTWNFTPEQCPTWFEFIAHFTAFWPMMLEFKNEEAVITAAEWPKLLRFLSTKRRHTVVLTLTIEETYAPSRALPAPEEGKANADTVSANGLPLHVLTLIVQSGGGEKKPANAEDELKVQLAGADRFLTEQPAYSTQAAYSDCPEDSRAAALGRLRLEGAQIEEQKSDARRRAYEDGIELFNTAETLLELFVPLTCTGPTIGKFWGAIADLAVATRARPGKADEIPQLDQRDLQSSQLLLLSRLRRIIPKVKAFQTIMSHVPKETRIKMEAPRQFVTAWLHVVSGLVLCRARDDSWESHFSIAVNRLLNDGMDMMIHALPTHDLLDSIVLQPFDVASLAVLKLLQGRASPAADINETYSQYLASLDNDIASKPSDRSYQHRIDLVRRELSAVRRTVTRQRHIIATMRQTMYPNAMPDFFRGGDDEPMFRERYNRGAREPRNTGYPNFYVADRNVDDNGSLDYALKVSPKDRNGFRGLLVTECSRLLDQRDFEFRRYGEYVDDLERAVAFKMDWTKDRQENAVYAFTIVTIIFLPLSAIAGIFGMNTSDVRNLEFGQWLYWVVALPVTLLVIVLGLWWMNELGNVVRWFTGQTSSGNGSAGVGYAGVASAEAIAEAQYYAQMEGEKLHWYGRAQPAPAVDNPFAPLGAGREAGQRLRRRMV